MKNLYLLIILILTITAAYFLVETDEQKQVALITQKREALNLAKYGEVTSILIAGHEIDTAKAIKENLDLFYDELQKLKVDRILDADEVNEDLLILKNNKSLSQQITFKFKSGKEVSFKVGQKIAIDQSFYLAVIDAGKTTWLVTRFETAFPADAADKDRNRSRIPYDKFIEVLNTPKSFFFTELKK